MEANEYRERVRALINGRKRDNDRIQTIEGFVDRPDGTKQYVRVTRVGFPGCNCFYEVVRDRWAKEEITDKMIKSDQKRVRDYLKTHKSSHTGKDKTNFQFTLFEMTDDELRKLFDRLDTIIDDNKLAGGIA